MTTDFEVDTQKEVSCRVTSSILRYLESKKYDVFSVVEGLPCSKEYLEDPFNWVPYETRETLCRQAAELTHDLSIMYQIGLATPTLNTLGGVESIVRLLIGPKTAYRSVSKYSRLFDNVFRFKIAFEGRNHALVTMSMSDCYRPSKHSCYFAQGVLAAIPTLWGLPPAEVRERKCMCQPDAGSSVEGVRYEADVCEYEVTWKTLPSWFRRQRDNLFYRGYNLTNNVQELERNLKLIDRKNAELAARNRQLGQVREIALSIDKVMSIDEVLSLVGNQSREIPGVNFMLVQTLDASGQNIITPYYSRITNNHWMDAVKRLGFDPEKELGRISISKKLKFPADKLEVVRDYLNEPRVIVKDRISELLGGFWPKTLCDAIQKIGGIKKIVIVPLLIDGKSWGYLLYCLEKEVPLDILEMIGAHCATAIKNIENFHALEQRNEELTALYSISQVTSGSLNTVKLLEGSIMEIVQIFGARSGAVYLYDEDNKALRMTAQCGMPRYQVKHSGSIPIDNTTIGNFFLSQEETMVGDMADYVDDFPQFAPTILDQAPLYFASAILHIGARRYGVITIVRVNAVQFSKEEQSLFSSISNQLSVSLENCRLHNDVLERVNEAEAARNELQKALDNLENSEEKFSKAFHASPEMMFITSSDGTIIEVNQSYTRISGYTREEVLGRRTTEIDTWVNPDDRDKILIKIWEAGRIYNEETEFRVKSGEIHTILFSNEVININNEACLVFVGTDITERKKMEETLIREAVRRRILIEQSSDGIVILDHTAKVYEANRRFADMLGYTHEEVLQLSVWDWEYKYSPERLLKMIQDVDDTGDHFETIHRRKDGSVFDVEVSTNGAMFGQEKLIFCVCRDITGRKQAEEKIRQSEKRYRLLAENLNDVIWTADISNSSRLTYISPSVTRLLGFTIEEAMTRELSEVFTADSLDIVKKSISEYKALESVKQAKELGLGTRELNMVRKDGSIVPVEINRSLIKSDDGLPAQILVVARDITLRKQAEERILDGEKYLRTLLDSFTAGAFLIDPETHTIVDTNRAAAIMCGTSKEEIIGKFCHRFVCPAEPGKCPVTDQGQTLYISEQVLLDKEGRPTPILKSVCPVTLKGRRYLFESFLDITKRKEAERALEQHKELIERILSTSPSAVLVIGEDFKVKLANQAFVNTFSKKMEEVVEKPIDQIIPVEEFLQEISKAAALKKSHVKIEFEYKLNTQKLTVVADILQMQPGEFQIVLNDVTAEREKQDKLYLTDRLASIGEMASGIAHELNNPLTGVVGLSQLLMEEKVPDNTREDLEAIHSEAQRAAGVVKNLLTFARKHEPIRQPTQINKIVEDVLKLRAYEHKVHDISVNLCLEEGLPEITADPFQIQQVFLNIILNAEQAMLESHKEGTLTVTTGRRNGSVTISFTDTGPGIAPENMRKLFSPFFTTKEVGKGTGLGLSVCYGIITGHGGRISTQSQPGEGAKFIVELPIKCQPGVTLAG